MIENVHIHFVNIITIDYNVSGINTVNTRIVSDQH